ncbi:MAG: DUF1822 family protein [Elainellaceae cyanobacterium]
MTTLTEDLLPLDAETLSPETVILSDESVESAGAQAEQVRPAERWQAYRNALALAGFQQWGAERGLDSDTGGAACSVHQPEVAGLLNGVCHLEVNGFRLCLVPTGTLSEDEVQVPRAAVELPAFMPQIFVLVSVGDELGRVSVKGALRHDQLQPRLPELSAQPDWTYAVPADWFDVTPDALLLYLRCLSADALALPAAPVASARQDAAQVEAVLSTLSHRLQTMKPIWTLLSWEQAATLLMQPELAHPLLPELSRRTGRAMSVGQWLQGQIDQVAQSWDWRLLPLQGMRMAEQMRYVRSPLEQFEEVATSLTQSGVSIPAQARGAYRDLTWQDVSVRLYAVTWDLPSEAEGERSWCLLLLLGPQPNHELPVGASLLVRDGEQVLDQQVLEEAGPDAYLFTQVEGEWHEQFQVTVDLTNGATITLPPFTFIQND